MTPDLARETLMEALITGWEAASGPTHFISGYREPDMTRQKTAFAIFEVDLPRVEQSAMHGNAPPKRYYGEVCIDIFAPANSGLKTLFDMQEIIENCLTVRTISAITLYGMSVRKRTTAIGWMGRHLTILYQFDSIS